MHFVPAKRRRFSASTSLLHPPHPPQHRHNGAMPYDPRPPGDDRRVRGRNDRGMSDSVTASTRPLSRRTAAPHAAQAAPRVAGRDGNIDNRPLPTDRHRHHRQPKPRRRSRSPQQPPHPGQPHSRRFRDSSRDRTRRPDDLFQRHSESGSRGRSRDREAARPAESHHAPPHHARGPPFENLGRPPLLPRSPPAVQRQKSPSPLAFESQSRRFRQEHSPRRIDREPDTAGSNPSSIRPETSSQRQERSLTRFERRSKQKTGKSKASPHGTCGRSPPRRERDFPDNPNLCPLGQRASPRRDQSLASFSSHRRPSPGPRPWSPALQGGRRPSIPGSITRGQYPPDHDRERHDYPQPPPRSPRHQRGSFPSSKERTRDYPRPRKGPAEPASGPNSIEVNMSARGNFRGAYGGQYPMRGHYNQGPHSSGHATPNSSFHGTPPAQSPYGGSRGSWGGQQQYSPQNQFPTQYPQNGYAPTAPAAHFHGNQANSPPIGTPTGPSNQFSQSPYRGGYRSSSSGGYRGNGGRGGNRGGFKSGHWGSSGSGSRAASSQPDEAGSGRATPRAGSVAGDQASVHSDSVTQEAENPFRPPKELQVEDTVREENNETQPMPPPTGRLPPKGPAAEKKISFALKSAPKAPVATPKLEISSKFNAPAKKDPPKEPSRDRHDPRDARESREAKSSRDPRDHRDHRDHREHRERTPPKHAADGRDLPRNVPTEPRAAKMAGEQRQRQEQQKPREPRVRMVKKKMKRLKEKPILTDGLAGSDSVYFRKPGNESVIGAGTYGKVFKALHVYTKKLVALKRIRMEGERDGFPVTAVREIKLLQSLRHINIVALLEVMVEKNECYMVFEYMSHDLTGILNHPTFKLDAAHRKHLSKQLFEGLDYLHQRGVLHRDIKAANILVSADGILKLADFGLARFYAKRHQLDYTNRVITIWYRSPELLLGETQYSPAVDIWSAACVMVEIFTRRAIFPGDGGEISQLDKIYSVLGTPHRSEWSGLVDMPWFELLRPGVRKPNVFAEQYEERLPPAAFKLLAEMLQYDPAKRPTAAQVLEHPYFTTESPPPRQAVELQQIDGDWHEFESKALRRENERKEREARKAAEKSGSGSSTRDGKDSRKRPPEANDANRENKRQHVEKPTRVPEAMDVTPAEAKSSQKA